MLEPMSETRKLTEAEFYLFGEDPRDELVQGVVTPKAAPSGAHSEAETRTVTILHRRFDRAPSGRWPGGWKILSEIHTVYSSHIVFNHDVAGWRRERLGTDLLVGTGPRDWARIRPDWVCEARSPSHEAHDRVYKAGVLAHAGVPHYWIIDPENKLLEVRQLCASGYEVTLTATSGQVVRAPPFDQVELRLDVLFGDADDID